ncbi:putative nucleotidyltransferase [Gloeocapsa sp. PCC 73106]|nr:putative nucleotidyltransferase [Gloeocapsa sp. PCC 73106]
MLSLLDVSAQEITLFCKQWKIRELSLFGSILRDDFTPKSDIDFLVSFQPDAQWSLLDLIKMEYQLQEILKRKIDLVVKETIENSDNWIRKQSILKNTKIIYGEGSSNSIGYC